MSKELDWDNLFSIEDFEGTPGNWTPLKRTDSEIACEIANARFREIIKVNGKRVYGNSWGGDLPDGAPDRWKADGDMHDTHTGIIICVKEIK